MLALENWSLWTWSAFTSQVYSNGLNSILSVLPGHPMNTSRVAGVLGTLRCYHVHTADIVTVKQGPSQSSVSLPTCMTQGGKIHAFREQWKAYFEAAGFLTKTNFKYTQKKKCKYVISLDHSNSIGFNIFGPDHLGLILIVWNSVGAISVALGKVSFESQVRWEPSPVAKIESSVSYPRPRLTLWESCFGKNNLGP